MSTAAQKNLPPDQTDPCATALEVHNLTAGYPGARETISGVSFDVLEGERVAIIGPNGAGKSTLFKALVGLIPHSTGHISLHGRDCRSSHNLIGYVPQYDDIDWNFPVNVHDVVMMGRTRRIGWLRWPGHADREAVRSALEQVGMLRFKDRQIGELSGGQKRRVFIARALAQETDMLLLDEPFSGVDVAAEDEIMDTLDLLRDQKISVLLATHDLHTATNRFDRLLLLKQHVVAFGSPQEVFTPEHLREAYGGRVTVVNQEQSMIIVADRH